MRTLTQMTKDGAGLAVLIGLVAAATMWGGAGV